MRREVGVERELDVLGDLVAVGLRGGGLSSLSCVVGVLWVGAVEERGLSSLVVELLEAAGCGAVAVEGAAVR